MKSAPDLCFIHPLLLNNPIHFFISRLGMYVSRREMYIPSRETYIPSREMKNMPSFSRLFY